MTQRRSRENGRDQRVLRAGVQRPGAAGERTGALHRRCLSGDAWAQPGDPAAACGRWVGVAPAVMERGGGSAEAEAGAVERPGRLDQRLECGVELRGGGWADGVSCALASDPQAKGGL